MGKHILPAILLAGLAFYACQRTNYDQKIAALEQSVRQSPTPAAVDSLIALYQEAAEANTKNPAAALKYLTSAAELHYERKEDATQAVRTQIDAIKKYGQDQNLAEAAGLMARIWRSFDYKETSTEKLVRPEVDELFAFLYDNQRWIDSCLNSLDAVIGGATLQNLEPAADFMNTAEGYSAIIRTASPEKSADLLMKAAGMARATGDFNRAIRIYYNVAEKIPGQSKAPAALFLQAFVYDNDLKEYDKAKALYEEFLKRYPEDEMADDAQNSLKLLGKSPDEIIQMFEKQNPGSTTNGKK